MEKILFFYAPGNADQKDCKPLGLKNSIIPTGKTWHSGTRTGAFCAKAFARCPVASEVAGRCPNAGTLF
jgi:hypothetical protein